VKPTFKNLSRTYMGLNFGNIYEDKAIDDYAEIFYCDIYQQNFSNDFVWRRIRAKIRDEINESLGSVPRYYEYTGAVRLGRYDFSSQSFPIIESTALKNVGAMLIYEQRNFQKYCDRTSRSEFFATKYMINLSRSLTFNNILVDSDIAESLLKYMANTENKEREVFARFRVKITAASKPKGGGKGLRTSFAGDLQELSIFADRTNTILIFTKEY